MIKNFLKSLYLDNRLFYFLVLIIFLYIFGYFLPVFYFYANIALSLLCAFAVIDFILLYRQSNPISAERIVADRLSNGDENIISIKLANNYPFQCALEIIDEIPFQFQKRDFIKKLQLDKNQTSYFSYSLKPNLRGEYTFGGLNVFVETRLKLVKKRFVFEQNKTVPVYPSYMQMKKYELIAFSKNVENFGLKKIRKIGHTFEFEQIRKYVKGDDIRAINWKATARNNELMTNQFQDERSQNIYCVIDMSRNMKMPFDGMTLLDYSINSSLAISSIALKKNDRAGLITFNNEIKTIIKSDTKKEQLKSITEALYSQNTNFLESNYPALYSTIKLNIKQRSLILLFTNFETISGLKRHLEYLKSIAKSHLLVVIFFKNTELDEFLAAQSNNISDVYKKTIAEKMAYDKKLIAREISKYGIQVIYTDPKNLTIETINKYLEIKSRRLL